MKKLKNYTSIALYDFTIGDYSIRNWAFYMIELFEKFSCPPNAVGISGQKKLKKFNPQKAKMQKYDWHSLEYMCFYAGGEAGTNEDWIFHSSFDKQYKLFYFGFNDEFLSMEKGQRIKLINYSTMQDDLVHSTGTEFH